MKNYIDTVVFQGRKTAVIGDRRLYRYPAPIFPGGAKRNGYIFPSGDFFDEIRIRPGTPLELSGRGIMSTHGMLEAWRRGTGRIQAALLCDDERQRTVANEISESADAVHQLGTHDMG